MKTLIIFILFILVSCRSLPQDMTPAPIKSNLMTLEMHACGKEEVGLNGCFYNQNLQDKLVIPLWHNGEYQIKSTRCQFLENKRYKNNQKLELTFEKLLAEKPESELSCLYNIKVFIDGFDNGFEGFFLLTKGDIKGAEFEFKNKNFVGYGAAQIREGNPVQGRVNFKTKIPGTIIWEGCQNKGERHYDEDPYINFQELITGTPIPAASCILTVGLIPDDSRFPVELAKLHINIYEKTIVSLPQPSISYKNEKLTVEGDRIVAAIGIDDYWRLKKSFSKKISANVSKDTEVSVRVATSNGRFILLKVKNGEILWAK